MPPADTGHDHRGPAAPPRLRPSDLARLAGVGLRTRKLRASLSALGIAIGVAAIVAVLGLSASSQAGPAGRDQRARHQPAHRHNGQTLTGGTAELPDAAPAMIGRLPGGHPGPGHRRHQRQRLPQPADPRHRHQRPDRRRGQPGPARRRRAPPSPGAATSTPPPPASRSRCSAPPPPSVPGHRPDLAGRADLARRHVVLRRRHPQRRPCWPPRSTPRSWSATRPPRPTSASTATPPPIYVRAQTSQVTAVDNLLAAQANPENPGQVDVSPALRRADRPGRRPGRVQRPVPRPGRGRAAGRRRRRRQHHGHLRPRTPSRDRAAPRPGRHQGPHPRSSSCPRPSCSPCSAARPASPPASLATAIYAHAKGWAIVVPPLSLGRRPRRRRAHRRRRRAAARPRAARMSPTEALWTL